MAKRIKSIRGGGMNRIELFDDHMLDFDPIEKSTYKHQELIYK